MKLSIDFLLVFVQMESFTAKVLFLSKMIHCIFRVLLNVLKREMSLKMKVKRRKKMKMTIKWFCPRTYLPILQLRLEIAIAVYFGL